MIDESEPILAYEAARVPPVAEMERRRAVRVEMPFPAVVRGVSRSGERFQMDTVLDNLSACGLYVRLAQPVDTSTRLFIVVQLALSHGAPAPRVAVKGRVVRVEPLPDGRYGVGVDFTHHRFLYTV